MKDYLKHILTLIIIGALAVSFSSCLDDDNDDYADWFDFVTINELEDGKYDFTLDNGDKLWIGSPQHISLKPKYERAIVYYSLLDEKKEGYDQVIKLYDFFDILTKKPIYIAPEDVQKQDSIGYDKIKVYSIREGGGYLNISFGYNAAGKEAHMINLVSAKEDLGVNDDVIKLEFRHNQKDDPAHYPAEGYVSFDLTPFVIDGRDKVEFEISWTDFSGETRSKKIEYDLKKTDTKASVGKVNKNNDTNLNIY
ncbi:NigD-like protein [Dysgonomonas sp. Marseille-P4361]|uniref:NigD-like protein n=1 Tax=Dysgonomonas sp. Marseille-P4361 TaxID=2161820 RepID=UPI000D5503DD|nr:NigD-like protein [Dysgonomonas sp. Marseille-P4361]